MKPCRAAETRATASGKRTRMASRRAIACSSGPPVALTCWSAAAVSSTAVLRVSVANCSRWASCTDSACCSANSRRLRIRSSGSPPSGKPKPLPSMSTSLAKGTLVAALDVAHEDEPARLVSVAVGAEVDAQAARGLRGHDPRQLLALSAVRDRSVGDAPQLLVELHADELTGA